MVFSQCSHFQRDSNKYLQTLMVLHSGDKLLGSFFSISFSMYGISFSLFLLKVQIEGRIRTIILLGEKQMKIEKRKRYSYDMKIESCKKLCVSIAGEDNSSNSSMLSVIVSILTSLVQNVEKVFKSLA